MKGNFLVREGWFYLRKRLIFRKHREVARYWKPIIQEFVEGNLPHYAVENPVLSFPSDKIIWQYWGQGWDSEDVPAVVQLCLASVDHFSAGYHVIRLDDRSVRNYINFPDFIWQKLKQGKINKTFFSDLLRLALLRAYGGVWLDATILLTEALPADFSKYDYFMYQRDAKVHERKYWESSYAYYWGWDGRFKVRVLNSIFFAKKDSKMISALMDIMLYYWKLNDSAIDYFFFQILFNELKAILGRDVYCPIVSDVLPHLLQTKINGGLADIELQNILEQTGIHKMTYFSTERLGELTCFIQSQAFGSLLSIKGGTR